VEKSDLTSPLYWHSLTKAALTKFFILHTLRQAPSHAYQLALYIEELTQGLIAPSEGTLYPTLAELEKSGYARSRSEDKDGRARKVYQLTRKGHRAYFAGLRSMREIIPLLQAIPDLTG
jgi:PadR family transcriptional regulator PadR